MFASCWFSGCVCLPGVTVITFICTHQKVFFTLYTEPEFIAMRQDYHLVLGREEEHVLRREIWAVTLTAWIFMVVLYLILIIYISEVMYFGLQGGDFQQIFVLMLGYGLLKVILITVFSVFSSDKSGSCHCSVRPRANLRRMCRDCLCCLCSTVMMTLVAFACTVIQFSTNPKVVE